jgi:hypothetical protein
MESGEKIFERTEILLDEALMQRIKVLGYVE